MLTLTSSVDTLESIETKSALVAEISSAKATSNESTDSTKSPETSPNLVSIELTSALVAEISASNAVSKEPSAAIALASSAPIASANLSSSVV